MRMESKPQNTLESVMRFGSKNSVLRRSSFRARGGRLRFLTRRWRIVRTERATGKGVARRSAERPRHRRAGWCAAVRRPVAAQGRREGKRERVDVGRAAGAEIGARTGRWPGEAIICVGDG